MDLSVLAAHLCLVASVAALVGAAVRLASTMAPSGLLRVVTTAVVMTATVVLESLLLGLFGLGGSTVALTAAALAAWVGCRVALPSPPIRPSAELGQWWRALGTAQRLMTGAGAGAVGAVVLTILHRPAPGFDGVTYHVPEAVGFVQGGHTGAVLDLYYGLPVGNYPLTNEVLLAWPTGISHGFAALMLLSPASYLLLLLAGWVALRGLGLPVGPRALALAALGAGPLLVAAVTQPGTDLPALTWLVCCGALCVAAGRERPVLLAPALVAFGLSVGTKTTPALLGLIVLGLTGYHLRRRLRPLVVPLAVGLLAAVGVGGVWYVRNLLDHGSPLWPFLALPGGDPLPLTVRLVSHTLLERFQVTLLDHLGPYLSAVSGSAVLVIAGVLVPAATRRRRLLAGAGVVALGALAWASAPVTGLPDVPALDAAVGSSVRYLLPVFAAGAVALGLAAADGPRWSRAAALLALTAAVAWSLASDLDNGFFLPFTTWLAPGVVIGAAAAGIIPAGRGRLGSLPVAARALAVALPLLAGVGLAAGAAGFVARHARVGSEFDAPVARFLSARPGFATGHAPVASAPDAFGLLAGDRLTHPVSLVPATDSCPAVRSLTRRGWVVIRVSDPLPVPGHPGLRFPFEGNAQACLALLPALFDDGAYRVYGRRG